MNRREKKGFTLAELMAVIAILAILAALALGSYRQSMDKVRMKEGETGAHTLAAAMDDYFYEHNTRTKDLRKLPTTLSKTTSTSDTEIVAGHFRYSAFLQDNQPVAINATVLDGGYTIRVPLYSVDPSGWTRCIFTNQRSQEMCIAGGYKTCQDGSCI